MAEAAFMCTHTRWIGMAAVPLFLITTATIPAAEPADLVVQNARVHTVNSKQPHASAFAVRGGTFVTVDSDDDIKPLIGADTKRLDLGGRTVVPGFTDAHAHPRPAYPTDSRWYSVELSPQKVKTMNELITALRKKAAITPPGELVSGFGYHETKLGRHPTRYDLDQASTEHPIVINHSSGHLEVCNSWALRRAGIDRTTRDPAGGRFGRDAEGEPNGLLEESAAGKVRSALPRSAAPPEDETIAAYRNIYRAFISRGVTGIHVAGTDLAAAARLVRAREEVPLRLSLMLREAAIAEAVRRKEAMKPGEADVRYGSIKIFHGNALSGQTCWLYEPYAHDKNYYGIPPARSQDALNRLILKIHEAGLQACVHTNGDREIDMVLDAFEAALAKLPRDNHRHRLEHCSVVNARIIERIRRLGLVVAPQSYIYEHGDKLENFGAWRWDWMFAARSMIDAGIPIAGNSDYSVSRAEPLLHLQDMVTRTSAEGKVYGPKQRTTLDEALYVWTIGGAFAAFEERVKGSIEPGKVADFVVLGADPWSANPLSIKDIPVDMTVIGGNVVYERGG
jgi:predicted amidohydrolase YtcJ